MSNRRDFLKKGINSIGFFTIFGQSLVSNIVASSAKELISQNLFEDDSYFIHFNLFGAPPRWYFDNFLKPNKSTKYQANPMTTTHFTDLSSQGYRSDRSWTNYKGLLIPPLWNQEMISHRQGRKMTDLLDNMLVFRGVKMGVDGHEVNNRRLMMPSLNVASIHGNLSDFSNSLLPSVNLLGMSGLSSNALSSYLSNNMIPPVNFKYHGEDSAKVLLSDFIKHNYDEAIERGVQEFLKYNAPKTLHSKMSSFQSKLRKISKKKLSNIVEDFPKVFNKYNSIIKQSLLNRNLAGVTDKKIPGLDFTKGRIDSDFANRYLNEDYYLGNDDLRDTFKTAKIELLAEQFALTEIIIKNGLSRCVAIEVNTISNLFYENCLAEELFENYENGKSVKLTKGSDKEFFFDFDAHFGGQVPHILYGNVFWFTLGSCLSELRYTLIETKYDKNSSVFDKTLIHLASEFERDPNPNLSGSEHGWNGHNSTFFSGMFEGHSVRGNIHISSNDENNMFQNNGTWGDGAIVDEFDRRHLVYGNIATSIATMLGIPSSTPKDKTLVEKKGTKIESLIKECRNV